MTISPPTHTRKRRPPATPPNDLGPTAYDNHPPTVRTPLNQAESSRRKSVVITDHGYDNSISRTARPKPPPSSCKNNDFRVCVEGQIR